MKSTGIIRKIDELGRIVIPKEIRNTLKISSNDDLEIFINEGEIILKKYMALSSLKERSNQLILSTNDIVDANIFISDKEKIITKGELENLEIDNKLKNIINERKEYTSDEEVFLFGNKKLKGYFIINPIIQNSDANGLVIIYKQSKIKNEEKIIAKILKNIIENS